MILAMLPADPIAEPILDDARFVITGEHEREARAVVYRAMDTQLGRPVAIKVPRGAAASAWDGLEREAAILSRLDQVSIPEVYHSGTLVTGGPYLVMKLVQGKSLEELLTGGEAGVPLLRHLADLADAVAHAHARGTAHGALDAGCVRIDERGRTLVTGWERAAEAAREPAADVRALGALLARTAMGRGAPRALRELVTRANGAGATAAGVASELRAVLPRVLAPRRVPGRGVLLAALVVSLGVVGGIVILVARSTGRARAAARALREVPTWDGTFGRMLFEVTGGRVRGVYAAKQGLVEGTLRGDTLELRWCQTPFSGGLDHGTATLPFVPGGAPSFAGRFRWAGRPDDSATWSFAEAPSDAELGDLRARLAAFTWPCPRGGE